MENEEDIWLKQPFEKRFLGAMNMGEWSGHIQLLALGFEKQAMQVLKPRGLPDITLTKMRRMTSKVKNMLRAYEIECDASLERYVNDGGLRKPE